MPDLPTALEIQIEKNSKIKEDLDKLDFTGIGALNSSRGNSGIDLESYILKIDAKSVEAVAMAQKITGIDMKTPLDKEISNQRRGWLSVHDTNIEQALKRLPPSSVIALMMESGAGRSFAISLMSEMPKPIYVISTSMGRLQIEDMIASKVMTESIYLDLKGKIEKSLRIDEMDEFILPAGRASVFLFMESGRIGNKQLDFGMIDEFKRKFTPPDGYLFLVVEKTFFPGIEGASLLSYISTSSVNTITFSEYEGSKYLEFSGFYHSKTQRLKLIGDFGIETRTLGRGFFE